MSTNYSASEQTYLRGIGQSIKDFRLKMNLSQEDFAAVCKLDRTYISDVERGQRNISVLNLRKIARALHTPVTSLIPAKG